MKTFPLLKKAQPLSSSFYLQEAPILAQALIGKIFVRDDGRVGKIVETEAYTQDDEASHTFIGKTKRNEAMFLARVFSLLPDSTPSAIKS